MESVASATGLRLDDPADFRVFYEDALPRIYGYFLNRCGGVVAVAEDLTQETFLSAIGEIKKGARIEAPLAWTYGIARHKLMDHYRSRERAERKLAAVWESEALDDVRLEEAGEEARERAIAALEAVAASQRSALVLRYLDGLSVPEVASALGKSVEAVESLLARGRESFKRAYLEASA